MFDSLTFARDIARVSDGGAVPRFACGTAVACVGTLSAVLDGTGISISAKKLLGCATRGHSVRYGRGTRRDYIVAKILSTLIMHPKASLIKLSMINIQLQPR